MKVELQYFKESGKYYSEGSYESEHLPLFQIWEEVRRLRDARRLPGLVENHSYYIVLVEVSEHEHNHPALII